MMNHHNTFEINIKKEIMRIHLILGTEYLRVHYFKEIDSNRKIITIIIKVI
jgi:hypothetical protein